MHRLNGTLMLDGVQTAEGGTVTAQEEPESIANGRTNHGSANVHGGSLPVEGENDDLDAVDQPSVEMRAAVGWSWLILLLLPWPLGYHVYNTQRTSVRQESIGESIPYVVEVNQASAAELRALPRVGEVTAARILQYREEHGDIRDIQQLQDVPGIGPKTAEQLEPMLRFDREASSRLLTDVRRQTSNSTR